MCLLVAINQSFCSEKYQNILSKYFQLHLLRILKKSGNIIKKNIGGIHKLGDVQKVNDPFQKL